MIFAIVVVYQILALFPSSQSFKHFILKKTSVSPIVSILSHLDRPITQLFASSSVSTDASNEGEKLSLAKDTVMTYSMKSNLSRTDLNEYVLMLEKSSSNLTPADSKLINGVWSLIYSGIGTPGLFIFQVMKALLYKLPFKSDEGSKFLDAEDITITISSLQPRVQATTKFKLGSVTLDVTVVSELEMVGPTRLKETFISAEVGAIKDIKLPSFVSPSSRELIVSYLDEDILIVRDEIGTPEILVRQSMEFPSSSEMTQPPMAS